MVHALALGLWTDATARVGPRALALGTSDIGPMQAHCVGPTCTLGLRSESKIKIEMLPERQHNYV